MSDESNENSTGLFTQIEDIKIADVSDTRLEGFESEDEFNALSVELLIEVGSYICVAGSILPGQTGRWNRNQAILGGHLVRLYKLISALLDQVCQRRREITFIIARLTFECIVNLRFLIRHSKNPEIFDSYVAYSFKQEKRLHNRISENIEKRDGDILPVEKRMLASIARAVNMSEMNLDNLSPSKPKEWGNKNLYQRAEEIGLHKVYLGTFGGPSAAVHGNWMDLLEMHLESEDETEGFTPSLTWTHPRPQIADTTALLAVDAVKDYFQLLFEEDSEFFDDRLDDLFHRIHRAMEAHEAFLINSKAL
ncbi:DUF5677 domain-containing protein [[Pseudomonas] carboxydohydrogena]|uniref:DUF5677 domain-containing protein n=1 Tax=Afipia carboxydohydrogena TaxID=290 RepID=A0ABY8BLI1_AFICR|nr:DUF5677 domain-containing protein [[Pseudomonas] carboxydohydrogena]WEF50321.1 DUF5677 domain-containing protein [[Pseudomonas] carboxydohydrogena]